MVMYTREGGGANQWQHTHTLSRVIAGMSLNYRDPHVYSCHPETRTEKKI